MESKPEFRKITKTEDGGQIIRIPKAFAEELGIDGDVVRMFCSGGRLILEKVGRMKKKKMWAEEEIR